jgi:RNA-directed DNA polymerase
VLIGIRYAVVLAFLSTRAFAEAGKPGSRFDRFYRTWTLPKKRGGTRIITSPVDFLKVIQRRFLDNVLEPTTVHRCATGFIKGLSIGDNAGHHVRQAVVANTDIAQFFPSTKFKLIRRAMNAVLPEWVSLGARQLAADLCAYSGGLPIGAPTSPFLANIILRSADRAIVKVSERIDLKYTRYADDRAPRRREEEVLM